jgi:nitroreductase
MEFESVIKSRESIRDYVDKKVEEEKINFVLESARLAPSWTNKQCWQFLVVKDKKISKG